MNGLSQSDTAEAPHKGRAGREITLALKNLDCALSQLPSFPSTVHSFLTEGSLDFFRSFLSIGLRMCDHS